MAEQQNLLEPEPAQAAPHAPRPERGSLAARYIAAPFSVLDGRSGWWQGRKSEWLARGIRSEVGRGDSLLFNDSAQPPEVYDKKNAAEAALGRVLSWREFAELHPSAMRHAGTSVFDPVVCELAYRWFSPAGGVVLDPFAGGSVRGILAAATGRQYVGIDLRPEQIDANRAQWAELGQPDQPAPVWHCGDSRRLDTICAGVVADFVFSCPPYADLEVYSDDPADLSTMDYPAFIEAYREIIAKSCALLAPDRFACFVVGDVRDRKGFYRGFVPDTVRAFTDAGLRLYNDAVLLTPVGSLAMRAGSAFAASRKLGKGHQNFLVFVKGDPKAATAACGSVT